MTGRLTRLSLPTVLMPIRTKGGAGVQVGMPFVLKARGKFAARYRICVSCREYTEKDYPSVTSCLYHVLFFGFRSHGYGRL